MSLHIGISGWRYGPWRGVFYPNDLPQKKELHFASRKLNSIEINGTFYSLQSEKSFQLWHDETPADFIFSVKGSRYITHIRRLKDVKTPLATFFGQGLLHLRSKIGPFLWQFPPNFLFYDDRLEDFFNLLPRTVGEAMKLSAHSDKFKPRIPKDIEKSQPLRHAIEVRSHSFENPDFIELLRKHDVALVVADTAGKWPYLEDVTSDFLYLRLHGDEELYASGYGEEALQRWARRIGLWSKGAFPTDELTVSEEPPKNLKKRDIFVYFDNDVKVRAPFDAMRLSELVKVPDNRIKIPNKINQRHRISNDERRYHPSQSHSH